MTSMRNDLTRRSLLMAATAFAVAWPLKSQALSANSAQRLVTSAVGDITRLINSGKSESAMYRDFEGIFSRYGDVPTIARFVLGPVARGASNSEVSAFAKSFQGYMARKYGKRFREFIGGEVIVTGARTVKSFVEVKAEARLRGQAPFAVSFMVSDRSGSDKFFDLLIEGISLLKTEQTEIGAMLDRRGGSIARLTQDLRTIG